MRDALLHLFFRRRWRGFETLYRTTGRGPVVAPNRYGVRFALHPHDYVDSVVLRDGFYESEVFEALRPTFAADTVFWDIGACFGLHAVTAAALYPGLHVHAFEPNPASQRKVQRNTALNAVAVTLHPFALADHDGQAPLFHAAPGNSGMATIRPFDPSLFSSGECVRLRRGDEVIASGTAPAPHVIKLDVEGSEPAVLAGLDHHLAAPTLRLIVLEAAPTILDSRSGDPLRAQLLDAGFRLSTLTRNEDTSHALINVAAVRPS